MAVTLYASGTLTTNGTLQNVFATVVMTGAHAFSLHLSNIGTGDNALIVVTKVWNKVAGVLIASNHVSITPDQVRPFIAGPEISTSWSYYFPPVCSERFRVEIQRIQGTDTTYDWEHWVIT